MQPDLLATPPALGDTRIVGLPMTGLTDEAVTTPSRNVVTHGPATSPAADGAHRRRYPYAA